MSEKSYDVAVVGATSVVGETILELLAERDFPVGKLHPLAAESEAGGRVQFGSKNLAVKCLAEFDFSCVQIAFFAAGADVAAEYATKAAGAGCVVIDNSAEFRQDEDVPLVVPEVNPEEIAQYNQSHIIANPNCSTIQMVVALKPIHDAVGIERINVATYQAVSGSGKAAIDELAGQTAALLNCKPLESKVYSKQIAFNILPLIDELQDNGYTREEMDIVNGVKRLMGEDSVQVNPTAVRVPVFFGYSEVIHIETKTAISASTARSLLEKAPGVEVVDELGEGGYPTAVSESAGQDPVFVGRIREDISHPRGLDLWVVADNVRKGAALNSVQIAEILIKDYIGRRIAMGSATVQRKFH